MDAQKLAYFLAAAHTENFRRAAQICHVTQPVLSRQIAALEQELGLALFTRERQRVALTPAGSEFVAHARAVMDRIQLSRQAMTALRDGLGGAVTVGCIEPLATTMLPAVLAAFHRRHPAIRTAITVRGTEELFSLVEQGELELGLCGLAVDQRQPHPLLTVQELYRDPIVLGVAAGHPLAQQGQPVSLEQLAQQPLALLDGHFATRRVLERALAQRNLNLRPTLEIDNVAALKLIVQHEVGLTVLPQSLFTAADRASGIVTLPLSDLDESLAFALLYRRIDALLPATLAFISALTAAAAPLVR
jgi:DNA-binding transcriptional LysR family regulator